MILNSRDRTALGTWLLSRAGMVLIAIVAGRTLVRGDLQEPFLDRWTQWDVDHLIEIARYGYGGDPAQPPDAGLPGFFPGFPLVVRATHLIVPDWRLAALLVSFAAGAVAMVALARLGDQEFGAGTGQRAVIALLLCPVALFLLAGYSEALFLAFALPAWLLARQGRWAPAALCGFAAAGVRITGVFLALALVVEFLTGERRQWRQAPWLIVPFLAPAAYWAYLWHWTGRFNAWQIAQEKGWGRDTVWPWQAWETTWNAAFHADNQFTHAFRVELAAAVIGVVLTLWLLAKRRWAESSYVGLQLVALMTSAFYLSIGRSTLVWWPLWLALGVLGVRRPWAYVALLALSVPLLVVQVVLYTSGSWAG
ncbi:hypothetical protein [Actinomadura sp. HBU206391]|uniref:hypothetical protein n=1 Tax=Actinomadura sp. HBU206391 TaxID=2731692 RepID=UPI00164F4DFA|nr:hypothetical protein [Actinomadura sp. HBU206391]MBC6456464.1 hypothetical protein [Actinomadura sp. HBU206391]